MTVLPEIIGLPFDPNRSFPDSMYGGKTKDLFINSLPILELKPMRPNFQKSVHFLRLDYDYDEYNSLLQAHGFSLPNPRQGLKIAFVIEGGISDSSSNSFGQTHLASFANFASESIFEASQILGIQGAKDLKEKLGSVTGVLGLPASLLSKGVDIVGKTVQALFGSGAKKLGEALALGHKIDFPNIWKGASTTMDYSVTVRLYNPNPSSDEAYMKYIVGPVAALLLFVLPRTSPQTEDTYLWPFYCKAEAKGLFKVTLGAVKDLSITKGGAASSFDYKQRPTIVELRFTIGEVFDTRVVTRSGSSSELFPTLRDYLEALQGSKKEFKPVKHYTPPGGRNTGEYSTTNKDLLNMISNKSGTRVSLKSIRSSKEEMLYRSMIASRFKPPIMSTTIKEEYDRQAPTQQEIETEDELKRINVIDTDPNDYYIPIGEVSYINENTKEVIIDPLDFDSIEEATNIAKQYENQGYTTKFVEGIRDLYNKITETIKDKITEYSTIFVDEMLSDITQMEDKIIRIGNNTIINLENRTAILDVNDFANKYSALKRKKLLEREGFEVQVLNDPDELMT